jgi:hypothetical protein
VGVGVSLVQGLSVLEESSRLYCRVRIHGNVFSRFFFSARCFTGFDSVVGVQRQAWLQQRQQNRPKGKQVEFLLFLSPAHGGFRHRRFFSFMK